MKPRHEAPQSSHTTGGGESLPIGKERGSGSELDSGQVQSVETTRPSITTERVMSTHEFDQAMEMPSIDGKTMEELNSTYTDKQIIDLLSTSGVEYLGTIRIRDGVMVKGFDGDQIIWETHELAKEAPWKGIWDKRLQAARASTPNTPCQYWKADAFVVTLKTAADAGEKGLLRTTVQKYEAHKFPISVFSAPVVRAVVWFKWHWARRVVFFEFCLFCIWLASFLAHATIYEPTKLHTGFWELPHRGFHENISFVTMLLATLFMLPFSYISWCEVVYNGLRHWLTFWNLFDALAQICQMICFVIFFFGTGIESNTYATVLSTQTVLLVLKIQYFSRAVLQVECAFIDSLNQILREAAVFLVLWIMTIVSFAVALFLLFKKDLHQEKELEAAGEDIDLQRIDELREIKFYYGSVFHCFFTLFGSMFKRFTYDPLLNSDRSLSVTLLFSIFLFLNTVTFYNLIVSIVVSSHKKMKERSQARLDTGRAQMLVELETAMPRRFLRSVKKPYIHFLKLAPQPDVIPDSRWLSMGFTNRAIDTQKEALTRHLTEAEVEIMKEINILSQRITILKKEIATSRQHG